jgi:outer membrane protein
MRASGFASIHRSRAAIVAILAALVQIGFFVAPALAGWEAQVASDADVAPAAARISPRVAMALDALEQARARRLAAIGRWGPKLEASVSWGYNHLRDVVHGVPDAPIKGPQRTEELTITQPLIKAFSLAGDLEIAAADIRGREAAVEGAKRLEFAETALADTRIVFARDLVVLRKEYLTAAKTAERQAGERTKAKAAQTAEVEQARERVARVALQVAESQSLLAGAEAARAGLDGVPFSPGMTPARAPKLVLPCLNWEECRRRLGGSPAVSEARADIARLKLELLKVRLERMPRLDATGFARRTDGWQQRNRTDEAYAGAKLAVPLPYDLEHHAEIKNAHARLAEAQSRFHEAMRLALAEMSVAWASREAAMGRLTLTAQSTKLADLSWRAVAEAYKAGDRSIRDVLDAREAILTAKVARLQADQDMTISTISINKILGPDPATPVSAR